MKRKFDYLKSKALEIAFAVASLILILTLTLPSFDSLEIEDAKAITENHIVAKTDIAKESDAQFLVTAAQINLEEIQLGLLAQTNAVMTPVKELGKMIEAEHSIAQSNLQTLAAKKQITIPTILTENGMDANKKLIQKQGKDFDKEYCEMMVSEQKNVISKFEKASKDAIHPDIRNWAASMLPALRTHLDNSITCQKQCENL